MHLENKPRVKVIIVGGGISGLTLANLLVHNSKYVDFAITILEAHDTATSTAASPATSIGGGIGLWPPSQAILNQLPNYQTLLNKTFPMPAPSYRDANGNILARAHANFAEQFPVLALDRDQLIQFLSNNIEQHPRVNIISGEKITGYVREGEQVIVCGEKQYGGDLLIACDGIHSKIRNHLLSELKSPAVHETDLGYTYFRANVTLPADINPNYWSVAFETWGTGHSKAFGRHELRFGYVPLKPPQVFWFIAIKTKAKHPYLAPLDKVNVIDAKTKAFLADLIKNFKPIKLADNSVAVDYQYLINESKEILRTDIAKIANVQDFPWQSQDGRIILLGDAAHATAPNIAQGAGLCIEDAACLANLLDREDFLANLGRYQQQRKPRAESVQYYADLIAKLGQLENPVLKYLRDISMQAASYLMPDLQRSFFGYLVSKSLGGDHRLPYWLNKHNLFSLFFANKKEGSKRIQGVNSIVAFKTSPIGGFGTGTVSVSKPNKFISLIAKLLGLPNDMQQQSFYAEVTPVSAYEQTWTRVFADKSAQQKTYSTSLSSFCDFKRRLYLSESVGDMFAKVLHFIYQVQQTDNIITYQSWGMTVYNRFKLPLPKFLLPKSSWTETRAAQGWQFAGDISLPLLGTIMHYQGDFIPIKIKVNTKRLMIAGGTGMVGQALCQHFIKLGYDVYCLTRNTKAIMPIYGVKLCDINTDWSALINANTIIINVSGANPGAKRWSAAVKAEIAQSRYQSIETIIANIARAKAKPLKFLQASAAGYYGDAGDTLLAESNLAVSNNNPATQFRIDVCQQIEKRAAVATCPVVNLRLGHVLANKGGLLPYCRWAGRFGLSRFGDGRQYVPFVHIHDVVRAIAFIAEHDELNSGPINIAAPESCTNKAFLRALHAVKYDPKLPVPKRLLSLIVGESAVVLTDSERVYPERLLQSGFEFAYASIDKALAGLG